MKLRVAWIGKTKESAIQTLTAEYLKRISRYVQTDSHAVVTQVALLGFEGVPLKFLFFARHPNQGDGVL